MMQTENASIRAFVAIALAPDLLVQIAKIQRDIDRAIGNDLVRWTRPEQLHLTLKFFGDLSADELPAILTSLRQVTHEIAKFTLSMSGIGAFPSAKRPSVIWTGITGDAATLQHLAMRVDELTLGAGSHSEDRAFRPHLTIGRLRTRDRDTRCITRAIRDYSLPPMPHWPVHEIHLIQSKLSPKGSTYTARGTVELL